MKKLLLLLSFIPTLVFGQLTLNQVTTNGNTSNRIMKYNANHGIQFDARTVVDKGYVDSIKTVATSLTLAQILANGRNVDVTGTIKTSAGANSIDVNNGTLTGTSAITANWLTGQYFNVSGILSLDVNNRQTYLGDGVTITSDYGTRNLYGNWAIAGVATLGVSSTTNGSLVFKNSTNANTLTINSGVTSASHAWTLPLAQGAAGTSLMNNGSGVLSWGMPAAGALIVGTTSISSGTGGRILYEDAANMLNETGSMTYSTTPGLSLTSTTTTSATYSQKNYNSAGTEIFSVRGNGYIQAGLSNGNMTIGYGSSFNTATTKNTLIGVSSAGDGAIVGTENTGVGFQSLYYLSSGNYNTGLGDRAGLSITTGSENTGIGYQTFNAAGGSTGSYNTAIGSNSFGAAITGSYNFAAGYNNMGNGQTGNYNIAIGSQAMYGATTNTGNIAIGNASLYSNVSGTYNTAVGYRSLRLATGNTNAAFGQYAFDNILAGNDNVAVGSNAGLNQTSGSGNIVIGHDVDLISLSGSNQLNIGGWITGGATYQTTVNNSGAGTTVFSEPFRSADFKKITITLSGATGTASYTFPVAFVNTPAVIATNQIALGVVTSISNTAVTVTGAASGGYITLEGY